ncbi:MAG: hypothetical protein LR008_02040 [Candidatus Pacebacteria bacterium]|nr:hypothetical protein [Candidatus Paceibacterota bacterium]
MINKKEFTKIAKRILSSQQGLSRPETMHPSREWFIGLLVAIIIFTASAFWSVQIFKAYQTTTVTDNVQQQERAVVYRDSLVEAALAVFSERQDKHSSLLSGAQKAEPELPVLEVEIASSSDLSTDTSSSTEAVKEEDVVDLSPIDNPELEATPE